MNNLLFKILLLASTLINLFGCSDANFKAPVAFDTGYIFPGAATLIENDDGTYVLTWPLPPSEKVIFRLFKRTGAEEYDFNNPILQTEKQIYITENLRFAPKTCFIVRFSVDGYEGDKNTNEVCSKEFDFKFAGIDQITRDDKNVWTLSWTPAPFKQASYRVFEVDPAGAMQPSALREVSETVTRMGPFPVGVLKCYTVRLLIGGSDAGDKNTNIKCTDANLLGGFAGIEKVISEATGQVTLNWTPAQNESVVGYLVYAGTDFKQLVTRVDLRQANSVTLSELPPGSSQTFGVRALGKDGTEDPNTRTVTAVVKDLRPLVFSGLSDASLSGKGEVLLRWMPVEGAAEYRVYVGSGKIDSRPMANMVKPYLVVSDTSQNEIRIQNLGDETEYVFLIRSASRFGVEDSNTASKFVVVPDQGAPIFRGVKAATTLADGRVNLTWEPALGMVSKYKVFVAKGSAAQIDFTKTSLPPEPGTSVSSIVGGFQANQFYTFAVRAEDALSQQDNNVVTSTVLVGRQSVPQFMGYAFGSALGEKTLRIGFNVTNDSNVLQYRVRARPFGTSNWVTNDIIGQDLSKAVISVIIGGEDSLSPLRSRTEYEILCTVIDAWGNESDNTVPFRLTTLDLTPPNFDGVTSVEQVKGTSSLQLSWMPRRTTDIEKYVVYWSGTPMTGSEISAVGPLPTGVMKSSWVDGASTTYTLSNLSRGQTYYFMVHAIDAFGNEDQNSSQVSTVVLNSFPTLVADTTTIRTPEREPGVIINLTASDNNQSDNLVISMAATTCPESYDLPVLTLLPQAAGIRKAQVSWIPSQDFIQPNVQERTCTATYKVFDGEANSPVVLVTLTAYNRTPRDLTASIAPVAGGYKRNQTITCSGSAFDDDGNPLVYDYQWLKNGNLISGATSANLTPAVAGWLPNDKIICRMAVTDDHIRIWVDTAEIVLGNSAPVLSSFTAAKDGASTLANLVVQDRLSCSLSFSDVDGDVVTTGTVSVESSDTSSGSWTSEFLEIVDCGVASSRKTCFKISPVVRRKFLRCKLEGYTDGFAPILSSVVSTNVVEVKNSTPKINAVTISPSTAFEVDSILSCNADVSDVDEDTLKILPTFSWTRDGAIIADADEPNYSVARADRNTQLRCQVSLQADADGFGSAYVPPVRSTARTYANSVPRIQSVQVTPSTDAKTGDILTCDAQVYDPDGDFVDLDPPTGVYVWTSTDGSNELVVPGQISKTLSMAITTEQDLRRRTFKCFFGLLANSDGRGAPVVASVGSANSVYYKNSNPVLSDVTVTAAATPVVTGTILTCNYTLFDLDGDQVFPINFLWYSNGLTISGANAQQFAVRFRDRGKNITCSVGIPANADSKGSAAIPALKSANAYQPINSEPIVSSVRVVSAESEPYYPGMQLSCDFQMTDLDGDVPLYSFRWYRGSAEVANVARDYVLTSADRLQNMSCAVILPLNADANGSSAQSQSSINAIAVQNRAPFALFMPDLRTVDGDVPHKATSVRCSIPAAVTQLDLDGDLVTVRYVWKKDGNFFFGTNSAGTESDTLDLRSDSVMVPGQKLTCQILISDGLIELSSLFSSAMTIVNRRPELTPTAFTYLTPNPLYSPGKAGYEQLTCNLSHQFTDPDADNLVITYQFRRRQGSLTQTVFLNDQGGMDHLGNTYTAPDALLRDSSNSWSRGDEVWCVATATDPYQMSLSLGYNQTSTLLSSSNRVVTVANTTPTATFLSCNGGNSTLQYFSKSPFETLGCDSDFIDGDAIDGVTFEVDSVGSDCPGIGTTLFLDASFGKLSGIAPVQACSVKIMMKDSLGAVAIHPVTQQPVTTVMQFVPPFVALFGRASVDNQCNVKFETSFSPKTLAYSSSSFSLTSPATAPFLHSNPSTTSGVISGLVTAGGTVKATWQVVGSNPSFIQNLEKTVTISDSPAVSSVPASVISMPGIQVTPAPNSGNPLRAEGCALADCSGSAGSITTAYSHSCAVAGNGRVYCWGTNSSGELGIGNINFPPVGTPLEVSLPVNFTAKTVSASGSSDQAHTCALVQETVSGVQQERGIYCWGGNQSGQLGRGTLTPVAEAAQGVPQGVVGLSGTMPAGAVETVAAGSSHTCALLGSGGSVNGGGLRCWGNNDKGQLGDGTTTNNHTPVNVLGFNTSGALGIALGARHTCAITNVRSVQCWGDNSAYQLGFQYDTDNLPYRTSPKTVENLSGVVALAAGDKHTCALLAPSGHVKCWGDNQFKQLGNSFVASSDLPLPTQGSVLSNDERAVSISAGGNHTCALLESGAMRCWGANSQGQLGDNKTIDSEVAVDVKNLFNQALAVEAGSFNTCVLKNTGGVACFGAFTALGILTPQKTPINNAMPQNTLSPAVPAAQLKNCRVLRAFEQ